MTRGVLTNAFDQSRRRKMFRVSFVVLAMASALALNGCSQCSQQGTETAPETAASPAETAPADAAATPADPAAAPADPAAPAEAAPADGAAAPAASPAM